MESNKFVRKFISPTDRQIGNNMAGTLGKFQAPAQETGLVSEDMKQRPCGRSGVYLLF